VPIWPVGRRREALTGNSEIYKRKIVQYLEKRGYYLKASSDVEATFADCILTKKDETREYWLEAKATKISLREASFLSQLGKYLSLYLRKTPQNRFRMMIACYNVVDLSFFEEIFDKGGLEAIDEVISGIAEVSEPEERNLIKAADSQVIRGFFAETTVIIANPLELEIAVEKITPSAPATPSLSDAEYAAQVIDNFGDVEPLKGSDIVFLNLFRLDIPEKLYIAETPYLTPRSIFSEKPDVEFPAFRLEKGRIYSFRGMKEGSLLGEFVDPQSVSAVNLEEFDKDENNRRVTVRLLNIWISNRFRSMGLWSDDRTGAYYLPKKKPGYDPITVVWTPRSRRSAREMTKPIMTDGKLNYWVHRAANVFAKKYWGDYYVQIRPRWLFSSDGRNPFGGERAASLDRAYRKSLYNRNPNKFYDVLFWYRYIFSEIDVEGTLKLDSFYEPTKEQVIKTDQQVTVQTNRRPNIEVEEEVELFDKIEPVRVRKLDEYL